MGDEVRSLDQTAERKGRLGEGFKTLIHRISGGKTNMIPDVPALSYFFFLSHRHPPSLISGLLCVFSITKLACRSASILESKKTVDYMHSFWKKA